MRDGGGDPLRYDAILNMRSNFSSQGPGVIKTPVLLLAHVCYSRIITNFPRYIKVRTKVEPRMYKGDTLTRFEFVFMLAIVHQ